MGFGHAVPLALMITADKRIHIDGINKPHGRQFVPSDQIFHNSQSGLFKTHSVLQHLCLVQSMQCSLCRLTPVVCPRRQWGTEENGKDQSDDPGNVKLSV